MGLHSSVCSLASATLVQERFADGIDKAAVELKRWDTYLAGDPEFLVGDTLTLADIAVAVNLFFAQRGGCTFRDVPHVAKYAERMKERKCFAETWPPHWKVSANKDWLSGL
jgi:glutathione S-transferase